MPTLLTTTVITPGSESAGELVILYEKLCEDRGECEFLGNRRDGDEITLFVEMERSSMNIAAFDAKQLFGDLQACSRGDNLLRSVRVRAVH